MSDIIKDTLKEIEVMLIKNTKPEEMIKHFAGVQESFEALQKENKRLEERNKAVEESCVKHGATINNQSEKISGLEKTILELQSQKKENEVRDMYWKIEREYAEKMISTLKNIIAATLTKAAVEQKGFLDLTAYLPAIPGVTGCSGNSGSITGRGEVVAKTVETKPEI